LFRFSGKTAGRNADFLDLDIFGVSQNGKSLKSMAIFMGKHDDAFFTTGAKEYATITVDSFRI